MHWTPIARRQSGLIGRSQLLHVGYSRQQIDALIRSRRLSHTDWRGVYRAAGAPSTPEAAQWAAVLGAGGVLSHQSAAILWDIDVPTDNLIHVTTTKRRDRQTPSGVRVHRLELTDLAVTERFRIPVTTRHDTVLDCLGILTLRQATTLFDRALQRRWLVRENVERRLRDQRGRHGNQQLRKLLEISRSGASAESERLLIKILREHAIAGWRSNMPVTIRGRSYILDFAFARCRVAIEVDGWAHHSDVDRFRNDRSRQNALVTSGWTVLRFTWWDLTERPTEVAAEIQALLR